MGNGFLLQGVLKCPAQLTYIDRQANPIGVCTDKSGHPECQSLEADAVEILPVGDHAINGQEIFEFLEIDQIKFGITANSVEVTTGVR